MLILRRPWVEQPPDRPTIDRNHPIGKDVALCLSPSAGTFVDLVTGERWTTFGTAPTVGLGSSGRTIDARAAFGGLYLESAVARMAGPEQTHVFLTSGTGTSGTYAGLITTGAAGGGSHSLSIQDNVQPEYRLWLNSAPIAVVSELLTAGFAQKLVIISAGASGTQVYIDGRQSVTTASVPSDKSPGRVILFGEIAASATYATKGAAPLYFGLPRKISSSEAASLWADGPWQIFEPRRILIPVDVASSGSSGTVAYTNANDTSSATGTTTVTGTLARTNAADTSAATGTTTVVGTLATTNANDSIVASGAVGSDVIGTVAYTNANDASAATGTTQIVGTLARTNAADTCAATGTTTVVGALASANANDTVAASGAAGTVTGTVAYTNANDTAAAEGSGGLAQAGGGGFAWAAPRKGRYGYLSPPTREQMAERVRKQRTALGILPKPAQKRIAAATKKEARRAEPSLAPLAPVAVEVAQETGAPLQAVIDAIKATFDYQRSLADARIQADAAQRAELQRQEQEQQRIQAEAAEQEWQRRLVDLRAADDEMLRQNEEARKQAIATIRQVQRALLALISG